MGELASLESALTDVLAPALTEEGYILLRTKVTTGGRYLTLQIVAERQDSKPVTVQDCVAISHIATVRLDMKKVPAELYTLEVTAPEFDRPLIRHEDFERFAGQMAVVDLRTPMEGRQRFSGRIVRVTGRDTNAELELTTPEGAVRVALQGIAKARLSGSSGLFWSGKPKNT
jgi:ribosome maturation factor RimP